MLACPGGGGARFKRHVDNSPDAPDTRAVTAVLYLNSSWEPEDGGALRIYAGGSSAGSTETSRDGVRGGHVEVEPRVGRCVWGSMGPHLSPVPT